MTRSINCRLRKKLAPSVETQSTDLSDTKEPIFAFFLLIRGVRNKKTNKTCRFDTSCQKDRSMLAYEKKLAPSVETQSTDLSDSKEPIFAFFLLIRGVRTGGARVV